MESIEPVETGETQFADTMCSGIGDIGLDYKISVENNSLNSLVYSGNINDSLSILNYTYIYFESTFTKPGDFLYDLNIFSVAQSFFVSTFGVVEDKIQDFTVSRNSTEATNATVFMFVDHHIGTNVTYNWTWLDSGTFDSRYVDQSISHVFTRFGLKQFNVTASNYVSSVTLQFDIFIEDIIKNVKFVDDPYATEFTTPTVIMIKIGQGTAMTIQVNYTVAMSPVVTDFDVADDFGLITSSYLYPEVGFYNISVILSNTVSNYSIWTMVPVEFEIKGFTTWLVQEHSGSFLDNYIEQDEILTVMTSVESRGMYKYNYDLGDGRNVTTENKTYTFSYPKWRWDPPYTLVVSCFNMLNRVNVTNDTAVQMPVMNLTNFQLTGGPENSTEDMEIKLSLDRGDYFNCTWNFTDGSEQREVSYAEYSNYSGSVWHQFKSGDYFVFVSCWNRLYTTNASVTVLSYDPATPFLIETFIKCPGKPKKSGLGKSADIFSLACDVVFKTIDQFGRNISYLYDFDYKNGTETVTDIQYDNETNIGETAHRFLFEKGGISRWSKTITITASNAVSEFTITKKISLIDKISNFTVSIDKPNVTLEETFNIMVMIINNDYKPCYVLEYGILGGEVMYPRFVFGHSDCQYKTEFQFDIFVQVTLVKDKFVPIRPFYFAKPDSYFFTVIGSNEVGTLTKKITVKVLDYPCNPPQISWESAMGETLEDAPNKAPFFKCRKYSILTKVLPDCKKANVSIKSDWHLEKVLDRDNNPVENEPTNMEGE